MRPITEQNSKVEAGEPEAVTKSRNEISVGNRTGKED